MDACIFCAIAAGEEAGSFVADEPRALAFMDLRQPHGGHVLVIPREHVETLDALEDAAAAAAVMGLLVRVVAAVKECYAPDGISVTQANGEGAGQEVPHVHFHVHPRKFGDGLIRIYPQRPPRPQRGELEADAAQLRAVLAKP